MQSVYVEHTTNGGTYKSVNFCITKGCKLLWPDIKWTLYMLHNTFVARANYARMKITCNIHKGNVRAISF